MNKNQNTTVIGLDPGGKKAFGWCIATLSPKGEIVNFKAGTGSFIDDIIEKVADELKKFNPSVPSAAGIDAPLFWSTAIQNGKSERAADRIIREKANEKLNQIKEREEQKKGSSSTILHINSLRGACLVNGVLSIIRLRGEKRWPKIRITEAHPGALKIIASEQIKEWKELQSEDFEFPPEKIGEKNNDEYDAMLAAFSAWKMLMKHKGWIDLIFDKKMEEVEEKEKLFFPAGNNIAYWFPKSVIPESEK